MIAALLGWCVCDVVLSQKGNTMNNVIIIHGCGLDCIAPPDVWLRVIEIQPFQTKGCDGHFTRFAFVACIGRAVANGRGS